jgi:hypothetical protein
MHTRRITITDAKHASRLAPAGPPLMSGPPAAACFLNSTSTLGSNSLRYARRRHWCTLCSKTLLSVFMNGSRQNRGLFTRAGG